MIQNLTTELERPVRSKRTGKTSKSYHLDYLSLTKLILLMNNAVIVGGESAIRS
jgi:hypothetical protein